ncbi:MAG: SWIM zinc finger family protein, partial [Spirochaetaceae bacterium]|nr:SWIM zinc finger family protein [Spirochaetaceae bacterium]
EVVSDPERGLFPKPRQIELACSCPDWATMCKHVAAVLYGVGHRLDDSPDLLFRLRGVDPEELISPETVLPGGAAAGAETLAEDRLGDVFGIDLDPDGQ